jgi:hypothetical protein
VSQRSSNRSVPRLLICGGVTVAVGVAAFLPRAADAAPTIDRVSVSSRGIQGNSHSGRPLVSRLGRFVAFQSDANNFVRGDRGDRPDIFVRDRLRRTTVRIARRVFEQPFYFDGRLLGFVRRPDDNHYVLRDLQEHTEVELNRNVRNRFAPVAVDEPVVTSAQARHFVFISGSGAVLVRDRIAGTTERVSDAPGARANGRAAWPSVSRDGRFVAFQSDASNLIVGDTNAAADVFVRDRATGSTTRVSTAIGGASANGQSQRASISFDGALVAFASDATNLVPGDSNGRTDVFVHNRATGANARVSVGPLGEQATGDSYESKFMGPRLLGFLSNASNLVVGDTNERFDGFLRDLESGRTVRSEVSGFSSDGRWAAFASSAAHVVGDTNRRTDAFVYGPLATPWSLPIGAP